MTITSIGDLAQSFMLRQQSTDLKTRMNQLVQEFSSGRTADVSRHLSGSYAYLADVERSLSLLQGYDTAASEALTFTDAMQAALENFQTVATGLGLDALSAGNGRLPEAIRNISLSAGGEFSLLVNTMNSQVGGRALFSGVDTDTPPLVSGEEILDELRTVLSGTSTVADVQTALDAWFDTSGGGFETFAYQGATTSLVPFQLGEGESVDLDLRADDTGVRTLLKYAAMAALAADATLGFDTDTQVELMLTAGEGLSFEQTRLVEIRANLGYAQNRAEDSRTRISAERTSYEIARTELLSVDPYEAATRLEDVQFQLEALYSVTVKLSRLSLTNYL
ncbi:flagellar biosynthesis protein FlgL [Pseudooceanicola sp. CBS1P-1]|uniref:Flagellar biosynthesis protein FlgL n=1 Tax=Pseudooceanicola albus TaxID=2692189 RepID=A0A6L7G704_9RHOB|nr:MULTISPECIES: flagellin [Pseudooceanicola]MBT9385812.1 flagellar biosynthesis protein FlgL [Pseudooceanicola endophyticus]MXN20044.1 flagellar biosynthesis protein FlgL [Pseudooceanicola albus]